MKIYGQVKNTLDKLFRVRKQTEDFLPSYIGISRIKDKINKFHNLLSFNNSLRIEIYAMNLDDK